MHLLSFFSFSRFSLTYVFSLRTRELIGWALFGIQGGLLYFAQRRGGNNYIKAMHVIDSENIVLHVGYVRSYGVVSIFAFAFSTINILFRIIVIIIHSSSFIIHYHI